MKKPPPRTVKAILDWALTNDSRRSPVTEWERKRLFGQFAEFVTSEGRKIGSCRVADCMGADLVEFLQVECGHLAQWTRRRRCQLIKRAFSLAAAYGLIQASPFSAVKESTGGRRRDITWEEFRALLRLATPAMRRVLIFLRFSGARPEEMRTLLFCHIDWEANQILKRYHKSAHKTGRPRVIPLSDPLRKLLLWILRHQNPGHDPDRLVFINSKGWGWTIRALSKNICDYRRKAGLAEDVKLYGCRHAFITEAVCNGLDVATVAEIAGHANIKVTETYLHLSGKKDHLQAAMQNAVKFGGRGPKTPAAPSLSPEDMTQLLQGLLAGLKGLLDGKEKT